MTGEEGRQAGHVLRGADGTLYFIPEEQLERYRVRDDLQPRANQIVEQGDPHFRFSESRLEAVAHVQAPPPESAALCMSPAVTE